MYAKNMFRIARLSWPPHTMHSGKDTYVGQVHAMLVHALKKKSSPVNDAWIYP